MTSAAPKRSSAKGIHYVDVGTSGGVWGLAEGYSLMIGGEAEVVESLRPIFETLAPGPERGWGRVGPVGAGHFVKMIHNGIEYGLMQAYAEGFEIMHAKKDFDLDLEQVAQIWRYGSVVRSWLLDLTADALSKDQDLSSIEGWVADSGEGRWTVAEAVDLDVPAPIITLSLQQRFISRQAESYAAKLLAAMRNEFGGHAVKTKPVMMESQPATTIVIFGASGDLTWRKLVPALYNNFKKGRLAECATHPRVCAPPVNGRVFPGAPAGRRGPVLAGDIRPGRLGDLCPAGALFPGRPGCKRGFLPGWRLFSKRWKAGRPTGCITWRLRRSIIRWLSAQLGAAGMASQAGCAGGGS